MADQNLEFKLDIDVGSGEVKLEGSFDKMGKTWERVLKKVSQEMNQGFKEAAAEADKISKGFDGLEKAVTKTEKIADSLRTKFGGSGEEINKLIANLDRLNAHQALKPEVAKIRDDREATPAGQHNLVADRILNNIKEQEGLDRLIEAEKESAIREQENHKRIQQEHAKTIQSIDKMEERVKKFSNEHQAEFEEMRQAAGELAQHQMDNVGGSSDSGRKAIEDQRELRAAMAEAGQERLKSSKADFEAFELREKQSSAELQREIEIAAKEDALDQQRIADAQKVADAEKASTDKMAQQQEKLNAEYQKADDYLSEQAKAMRDMGSSGAKAAADIEGLRTELQELHTLQNTSSGGGGGGGGSGGPPNDPNDDLEKLRRVHQYRLEAIKAEAKEADKAHNAANQDHTERLQLAKKEAETSELLAVNRYKSDKEYASKATQAHAQLYASIDALKLRSAGMSKAAVESEIQGFRAIKDVAVRTAQEVAQAKQNQGFSDATGMNKANQAIYNAQQTIEDFSYAGLKGATNNLAFLASSIGGPGGVAAMLGIMTLNVLSTTGALKGMAEWTGISTEKTKEETAALDLSIDRFIALQNLKKDSAIEWASAKPTELVTDKINEEIRLKEIANSKEIEGTVIMQKQVALYKQMEEEAQKVHDRLTFRGSMQLGGVTKPEDILKNMQGFREANQEDAEGNYAGGGLLSRERSEAASEALDNLEKLSEEYRKLAPNSQLSAGAVKASSEELTQSDKAIAEHKQNLEDLNRLKQRSKDLETPVEYLKERAKADDFGTVEGFDPQQWQDRVDKVNSGVEGAGGKAYTAELKRQKAALQDNLDQMMKATNEATAKLQAEGKTTEEIKRRVDAGSLEMSNAGDAALAAAEASQKRAEAISDTVEKLQEAEKSLERQISDTERLIETENKHLASIEQAESARQDNEERRRNAAKDRIEDLRTGEKVEAIDKNLAGNKDWASNRKAQAENWANNNLTDKAKQNFQNQLNWEYDAYVKGLDNRAKADKEHAEKQGNAAKQKNLDALKANLGGKAQDEVQAAAADGAGGDFEKAQGHIDKARKALEELQRAQERVIGKGTVKQAEDAQKDMDATGRKLQALSEQEAALAKERQKQANEQVEELKGLLDEVVEKKVAASEIKLNDPEERNILNGIIRDYERILELKTRIQAVQAQGAAPGGGGVGGPQANAGNVINNNMVANMGGASPASVFAAMAAAAQNFAIQRG